MSLLDWVGILAGLTAILGSIWAVHKFTTKALVRDFLSELKPNGGSSIKDKVNKIEEKQDKMESRIDQIYLLLIDRK